MKNNEEINKLLEKIRDLLPKDTAVILLVYGEENHRVLSNYEDPYFLMGIVADQEMMERRQREKNKKMN